MKKLTVLMIVVLAGIVSAASIDRTGSFKISYNAAISDGECGERVFDNDTGTKWLSNAGPAGWIIFDFSEDEAYAIDSYTITSANDGANRTLKNWTLDGSNDGISWTTVDTRNDQTGWAFFEKRTFTVASPAAYQMYRLNVTANNGDGTLMGFSEMELLEGAIDRTSLPGTVTSSSNRNAQQSARALFDNANRTKWLTVNGQTTGWVRFQFADSAAYRVNGYTITSAEDASNRDPKNWTLRGSNDGATWTVLDTRTNQSWPGRHQRRLFEFNNFTEYAYYELNITANNGSVDLLAFSELELLDINEAPKITFMSPGNFTATSANPLVLKWDSVFNTPAKTYTVNFGTDPNFVDAGALVESGLTGTEWTVPEIAITDDTVYYWRIDIVDDPFGTGTETYPGPVEKFRVFREPQKVLEWSMDSFGEGTVYAYENPIQHVTATASSQESGSRSPNRTVGSYGLVINPSILDPNGLGHSNLASDMWISQPDNPDRPWIQFAFEQAYALGTMHVWNHNVGEPWLVELERGMRDVIVSYSQDAENWIVLGNYTIPMGTGQTGMAPNIGINFNGIEAQYVRITAAESNSNWGAGRNYHALSEVRFGLYNQPATSYIMPDMTGNGNDGKTYVDPQLVSEAIAGTAIDLSGDDMVYMVHTDANLVETLPLGVNEDCYDSWSMNFYSVFPETPLHATFMVGFGDFDTGTGRYIVRFSDGIRFWGGHDIDCVTNVPFDTNRWQMITATYESGTLRLYKNAVKILEQPVSLGVAAPKVSVSGYSAWPNDRPPRQAVGLFDEVTIYKGALSQAQIELLKTAMPTQYAAINPVPADESENLGIDPLLSWEAPRDAIDPTYTLYLGTDPENLPAIDSGLTATEFDTIPLGLAYGTTYYWYVDTENGDASALWSFTTMPPSSAPELALGWDFEDMVTYQHDFEQAIENVIATASSYEDPTATGRSPDRAANGIGMWIIPQIADANALRHSNNATHMWISQPDDPNRPWIKFGFDQAYALGTVHVWNHNVGEPWLVELNRGMRDVIVRYGNTDSADPNDYTILGNYTIPMGTGQNGAAPSIAIPFGGIEAQYVMIQAAATDSHWGNDRNFHALSEVRFGIYGTTASSQAIADTAGNGNEGVMYNGPALVNGLGGGTAVRIDPVDSRGISGLPDYINGWLADTDVLPFAAGDTWSMNLYINLDSNPTSPTLFAGFGGTETGTGRFVGRFGGVHFWGGNNIDVSSSKQYRYRNWQMVTATYSGTELKLYLNGVELNSGSPNNFVDAVNFVTIAGWNPWGNRFTGLVDNFELYRGVLGRADIAALAAALPIPGDMDWNGTVDVLDLPIFVSDWLISNDCNSPSDFTGDCKVNLDDFAVVAENWLTVQ
jgi:hypothetical protein